MDWFEVYQRMIYPRTPVEEVEYSYSTIDIEEIAEGVNNKLNLLESKISGKSSSNENAIVIEPLLEYLGALKTIISLKQDGDNNSNNCLKSLEARFIRLLEEDFGEFVAEAKIETQSVIQKYIEAWDNFVYQVSLDESKFTEYWNIETSEPVIYDYSEEYQDFLARIKDNLKIVRAVDHWDYLAGLAHRYIIARYMQLAECFFDVSGERARLNNIDEPFKASLVETPVKLLSESNGRFFSPDYFWWYYMVPANLFLIGSE